MRPNVLPIESLTDQLHSCLRAFKQEPTNLTTLSSMKQLTDAIRTFGYHPYYLPKDDIIIVSRNQISCVAEPANA
jgi:hypothetical protein